MNIKNLPSAISKGAKTFANYASRQLADTSIKVAGVVSILIGLAIWGALVFGLYKFAMYINMPNWHGTAKVIFNSISFGVVVLPFTALALVLSIGPFVFGKTMLSAKRIEAPSGAEGEL